ncbi:MAG TPA: glycerol-3-phosphate dehydrogenase [Noviherbaspirillum sp.]|nr:glycerol-3-phosphate dehydrogenase [Noviherbaspirillum sp.]
MPRQLLECDLLIIGGGINGVGIARDAAGRGLSVVLCEKDDLGAHTSSASSKLIHGGLRYLENREFGLVRKALIEREVLLRAAPHIMWPMRFVLPHDRGQRPAWMIRTGLFLYDSLARRDLLPGSQSVDLRSHPAGDPLKAEFTRGFVYSDGWVDDARLVALSAVDAAAKGARILTRTACTAVERVGSRWSATLWGQDGAAWSVSARALVNAAGPWAAQVLELASKRGAARPLRLIKGSHIVVPRMFDHPYAYIFQHPDGRIVFAIPFQGEFTLIGTTDIEYHGDAGTVAISSEEITYLCDLSARYFSRPVTPADVVWSYSGVRPLVEDEASDASSVTRDYKLELEAGTAPLLSVLGGKITTFRKLAEEAVDLIAPLLSARGERWTADACLPGGDLYGSAPCKRAVLEFDSFVQALQQRYAWLPPVLMARYARAYGTRTELLLAGRNCIADMGDEVTSGLYEAEIDYLVEHEWARTAADILWRRTKLGLRAPPGAEAALDARLAQRVTRRRTQA